MFLERKDMEKIHRVQWCSRGIWSSFFLEIKKERSSRPIFAQDCAFCNFLGLSQVFRFSFSLRLSMSLSYQSSYFYLISIKFSYFGTVVVIERNNFLILRNFYLDCDRPKGTTETTQIIISLQKIRSVSSVSVGITGHREMGASKSFTNYFVIQQIIFFREDQISG